MGLALLQVNQMELMQLDMEGMSQVGQGPRAGWDRPPPLGQRYLGRQSSWEMGEHSDPFPSPLTLEASLEGQGGPKKPQPLPNIVQGQQPDSKKGGRPRP